MFKEPSQPTPLETNRDAYAQRLLREQKAVVQPLRRRGAKRDNQRDAAAAAARVHGVLFRRGGWAGCICVCGVVFQQLRRNSI